MSEFLTQFGEELLGLHVRLSPIHVASTVLIGYLVYRSQGAVGSFFAWLFPARTYLHPSHWTDIKLFVFGRALAALGLFSAVGVSTMVAAAVMHGFGGPAAAETTWHPVLIAAALVLASDFGVYWVHRIHHETASLWPFHAVHHSAEVLTPVTVYRKHPVYDVISMSVRGMLIGILQGVLLAVFVGKVEIATIAGTNAVYVAFNFLGANLRHSHIWLSYGRALEHVLISPAQHQIHHSLAPRHQNKNYGEVLAVWDWMFGTLYVPSEREDLAFGLSDGHGGAITQPHGSFTAALIVPFRDCWRALRGGDGRTSETEAATDP